VAAGVLTPRYALAGLQAQTLLMAHERAEERSWDAAKLVEAEGFEVVGWGTSRVAVGLGERVAKVAHDFRGLAWNLQEASAWRTFPESLRQHLTPCHDLSPELVLVQERVEVLGPSWRTMVLLDSFLEERQEAVRRYGEEMYACRAALGLESDSDPDKLRVDNFGLLDGRVVAIDYGDQFPPLWNERLTAASLLERAGVPTSWFEAVDGGGLGDVDVAKFLPEPVVPELEAA
jgi:hypothetical protein